MANNNYKKVKDDFQATDLLGRTSKHDRDIDKLREQMTDALNRLALIEHRVSSNEEFAKTFMEACEHEKIVDTAIGKIIDKHDNHKIKITGIALVKWGGALVIGAILGHLIQLAFSK